MIKFLEDLIADLFGARDHVAIPVRVEDDPRAPGGRGRSDRTVRRTGGRI